MPRIFTLLTLAALLALAAPATAQNPLAGEGENMEILANVDLGNGVTEMELAGDYAYVVHGGGMSIIDISKPASAKVAGVWECAAGWGDVEIDPYQKFALVANAYGGSCADDGNSLQIIDISNKSKPKSITGLEPTGGLRAHTITLDGRYMYINTGVWAANPNTDPKIQVYDISDLSAPKLVNEIRLEGATTPHDAYVDHRPDGKVLYYSASGHDHYVIDVTDPTKSLYLQTTYTPQIEYAHQDEPNFDRKTMVASDESLVGLFGGVCGATVGAIYFYALGADGQWGAAGAQSQGFWGLPPSAGEGGCSAHVYWQAPDQNRLTMGMYTAGITVLDYKDPMDPQQIGWFKPEGGPSVWGAKAHNGHVYASGERGLDVLRYTGENGTGWPATAGPAEVQRAKRMGITLNPTSTSPVSAPPPAPPASAPRKLGRFAATAKIRRVPGRRGRKVALTFIATDAAGKRVAQVRVKRAAGRKATLKARGVGVVGAYRWTVKAGRKRLARGRTTVRETPGLVLAPSRTLEVLVR